MSAESETSGRPTSLRARQKLFTRGQLLEAATEEFASRGYVNTTVDDIVARAGTSRATFYMHFASKAEVLSVINDTLHPEIDDLYRALDAALAAGSRDDLRGWFRLSFDWWERHLSLVPTWEQAILLEPEITERANDVISGRLDLMTAYLGRFAPEEREQARLRIMLLDAQLSRFLYRWPLVGRAPEERAMVIDVLTEIWHGALHPTSPTSDS
jgi:AcrR family transcriptional regulator